MMTHCTQFLQKKKKCFFLSYVTINCKSFQTTNKNRYNLQTRLKETFDKLNIVRHPPAYEVLYKQHTNPKNPNILYDMK